MTLEVTSFPRAFSKIVAWFKERLRDKEKNQKDFFMPYYDDVEKVILRHRQCAEWLKQEERSYLEVSDDEFTAAEVNDERSQRMKLLYPKAYEASGNQNLAEMSVEITNLINSVEGVVNSSLIDSLREYATTCSQVHHSGNYALIELPCKNLLVLIRDLKTKIPSIHDDARVE